MNYDPYQAPSAPSVPPPLALGGQISERAAQELIGTQAWVRFVSVLMLVFTGFMLLSLILALLSPANPGFDDPGFRSGNAAYRGGYVAGQFVAFFIVGVLFLYPSILLAKYASAIKRFRYGRHTRDLEEALRHQRFYWRFIGIVLSVVLVLMVIALAAGASGLLFRASRY